MESVTILNKRLADYFGISDSGQPNWRVVFSDDQFEKRLGDYEDRTTEGILIRVVREVRLVPKYRGYIKGKWVLEHLTPIEGELYEDIQTKLSYEPVWVFQNKTEERVYPTWKALNFLIKQILAKIYEPSNYAKYKEDESTIPTAEAWEKQVDEITEELFGDDTDVSDALHYGTGIVVPTSYEKQTILKGN